MGSAATGSVRQEDQVGDDYRSRPRRRGTALEDAIMDATIAELGEVGYNGLTIDAVARRAGAGKTSVYRRWPSRVRLAQEAVYRLIRQPELPPEPSTMRDDLLTWMRGLAAQADGPMGEAMRGVLSAAISEAGQQLEQFSHHRGATMTGVIVARAVARGEPVNPSPPLSRLQVPSTLIKYHLLTHPLPVVDADIVTLVDDVLLPLLRAPD